jgi:hypothetical protein
MPHYRKSTHGIVEYIYLIPVLADISLRVASNTYLGRHLCSIATIKCSEFPRLRPRGCLVTPASCIYDHPW